MGKEKNTSKTESSSSGSQSSSFQQQNEQTQNSTQQEDFLQQLAQEQSQKEFRNTAYQASPLEQLLNQLQFDQLQNSFGGAGGLQGAGFDIATRLALGGALPGAYNNLYAGVGPEDQDAIVRESLRDIPTQLQAAGALDSGVGQSLYARGAQNVRAQLAQSNLQNRTNLLLAGLAGVGGVLNPMLEQQSQLGGRLAGLRSQTQSGDVLSQLLGGASGQATTTLNSLLKALASGTSQGSFQQQGNSFTTNLGPNPFLNSFQKSLGTSLGTSLGSGSFLTGGGGIPH